MKTKLLRIGHLSVLVAIVFLAGTSTPKGFLAMGSTSIMDSIASDIAASPEGSITPEQTTVTLYAVADVVLVKEHPTTNYGADSSLRVYWWDSNHADGSLVRFDLTSGVPTGAIIDSAQLQLYLEWVYHLINALPVVNIGAYRVTSPWNEYNVTWNSNLTIDSVGTNAAVDVNEGTYKTWDVTSAARQWHNDPGNNYGTLLIGAMSYPYYHREFRSREAGGYPPRLIVTYHMPPFCDLVSEIPKTECEALVSFYNSTFGPHWTNRSGWLTNYYPCTWHGVTCGYGHITDLVLPHNNLSGTLPGLSGLGYLVNLDLSENYFIQGNIPSSLCNLSHLQELNLALNTLAGNLPVCLGNLAALQELYLSMNSLSGDIPSSLGNLHNLRSLALNSNKLTGNLPTGLGDLTALRSLGVDNNPLNGGLPQTLTNLDLDYFWFDNTNLCEPPDVTFQSWLASIPNLGRTNVRCATPTPTITPTPTSTPSRTPTHTPPNLRRHLHQHILQPARLLSHQPAPSRIRPLSRQRPPAFLPRQTPLRTHQPIHRRQAIRPPERQLGFPLPQIPLRTHQPTRQRTHEHPAVRRHEPRRSSLQPHARPPASPRLRQPDANPHCHPDPHTHSHTGNNFSQTLPPPAHPRILSADLHRTFDQRQL